MSDEWMQRGLCRDADWSWWFPDSMDVEYTRKPLGICHQCPVRLECLDYALVRKEEYGIYGGLTPRERAKLRHPSGNGEAVA